MKRIIISSLLLAAAICAGAQNMNDALTFSENYYEGTARSIALGNAMTALGGDLGSIVLNPAGSAVSGYSQLTLTPSLSVCTVAADYSPDLDTGYYGLRTSDKTSLTLPNIGFNMVWDTYRRSGLKRLAFGIISNTTRNYYGRMTAAGENSNSSMFQSMAAGAYGYTPDQLNRFSASAPWDYSVAFQSGLISRVSGSDDYVGVTEVVTGNPDGSLDFRVPGILDQMDRRYTAGAKKDVVVNLGMNFSDRFFLGFNLGLPVIDYAFDEKYCERPVNSGEFIFDYEGGTSVSLEKAEYNYSYRASATGIYGKVGFIWLPFDGLRIGGAIQTPTLYDMEERFQVSGSTSFSPAGSDGMATSPVGEYGYYLSAPSRFNVGAAYTFGRKALLSMDYEQVNYFRMRFSEANSEDSPFNGAFGETNGYIHDNGAVSRMFRAGLEYNVVPQFAVRAGYSTTSSGVVGVKADTRTYAFGVGYSSPGSFFMDYAVRMNKYPYEYITPYADCLSDDGFYTPEIRSQKNVFDVVLTLGLRF